MLRVATHGKNSYTGFVHQVIVEAEFTALYHALKIKKQVESKSKTEVEGEIFFPAKFSQQHLNYNFFSTEPIM